MKRWRKDLRFRASGVVEAAKVARCPACGSDDVEKHRHPSEPLKHDARCRKCHHCFAWRYEHEPAMLGVPVPVRRR